LKGAAYIPERLLGEINIMHLLIACAITLAFAIFLDRSRVRASGLLFVLKDYVRRISQRAMLRRLIYTIGILLFVLAAWQAVGFDWAFIALGGDAMLYLEIVAIVYLVAVRGYSQQITRIVVRAITRSRDSITALRSRSRDRKTLRRNSSSDDRGDDEAEPATVIAFVFSVA
jgi:hypothetical protein